MKRYLILLLFSMVLMTAHMWSQSIDESYVFMDDNGNILENGATVVRSDVEIDDATGAEIINSGIWVLNVAGGDDYLKVHYVINRIDNGTYQICFPSTCNMKTEVGSYETGIGPLMTDIQDLQSEWFPIDDGECSVTLNIEILTKKAGFPPSYSHKAWGPTLTLKFVKSGAPHVVDGSFVFMDNEGNIIENGATVVRDMVEPFDQESVVINSGISVMNVAGSTSDNLKVHYVIERIDNGTYQICFPSTCNMKTEVGTYETGVGPLMADIQDLQSEWFPTAAGECEVNLTIEIFDKAGGFPPVYIHKAWGPSITLRFVKGEYHNIYCVNDVYYYKTGNNTVSVTYKDDSYNSYHGNIIIPETIEIEGDTYLVTEIANNSFKDCLNINSISIPVTITSIATNAFSNCSVSEVIIYGTVGWQAGKMPIDMETLYICGDITSVEGLNVNPSLIYSYSKNPPVCDANTFKQYTANLHVPVSGTASYFMAPYWCNFANIMSDAIEPMTLSINEENVELEKGKQIRLTAVISPNNSTPSNVKWLSTNQEVATVNNGTVTAETVGECDIIAFCLDKQVKCHVRVTPIQIIISLDKHEVQVLPNHLVSLIATCYPASANLAVNSSDNTIALPRLLNGTIQVLGLKEGTAIITVNTADGTGIPDMCEVTVYTENGDVNSDGYVNISDVTALIDFLLSGNLSNNSLTGADCNKDGNINISDVTALIDFLLSGSWP